MAVRGQIVDHHIGQVRAGLAERGLHVRVDWAGDVVSAYFSGTAETDGYLILAGTGARIQDGRPALVCEAVG